MYLRNFLVARGSAALALRPTLDLDLRCLGLVALPDEVSLSSSPSPSATLPRHHAAPSPAVACPLLSRPQRSLDRARRARPPPPLPRTKWTSLVPPLVLTGHAASLPQVTLNNCALRGLPTVLAKGEFLPALMCAAAPATAPARPSRLDPRGLRPDSRS